MSQSIEVVIVRPDQPQQLVELAHLYHALQPLLGAALAESISASLQRELPREALQVQVAAMPQVQVDGAAGDLLKISIGEIRLELPAPPADDATAAAWERFAQLPTDTIPAADALSDAEAVPQRIEVLPNELFIGRDDELRRLARTLKAGGNAVVTTGPGGVGKSRLAAEFAHRYGRYFAGGVFRIDCSEPERIPQEIAAGGGPGGLDLPGFGEMSNEERLRQVREHWRRPLPRLLIFDNCANEQILHEYRPLSGGCQLLVTSRYQQWAAGRNLHLQELDGLARPDSIELLRKLAPRLDNEQADAIASEFGDLPLALQLAGGFLERFSHMQPGDRLTEADVRCVIGDVQQFRDELDAAFESYQQALELYREIGNRQGEATLLATLARLVLDSDPAQSQAFLQQALAIRQNIQSPYDMAADLGNYGIALLQRGRNVEALPYLEQARSIFVERGVREIVPQLEALIAQARGDAPGPEWFAALPEAVRVALVADDSQALQAALAALPEAEAGPVVEQLQAAGILDAPAAEDPRERFAPLLQAIALVAAGESGLRRQVEAELLQMEQGGWQLGAAVRRIWRGERDLAALTELLDLQDHMLIERILAILAEYEANNRRLPSQVLAELPEPVRSAVINQDEAALNAALAALPAAERNTAIELLAELNIMVQVQSPPAPSPVPDPAPETSDPLAQLPAAVGDALVADDVPALQVALAELPAEQAAQIVADLEQAGIISTQPGPAMDEVVQEFSPLLGDIALAAQGDAEARALAEAVLPGLEQAGWQLQTVAQRLWQGERETATLIEGIDRNSAQLVEIILQLLAADPADIAVAGSRELQRLRNEAARATAAALRSADAGRRATLANALEQQVGQLDAAFAGNRARPYQATASELRALIAQLRR